MRATSVMRFVLFGAVGFGIGGAIVGGFEVNPLVSSLLALLLFLLGLLVIGTLGGASLGLAMSDRRKAVILARWGRRVWLRVLRSGHRPDFIPLGRWALHSLARQLLYVLRFAGSIHRSGRRAGIGSSPQKQERCVSSSLGGLRRYRSHRWSIVGSGPRIPPRA